MYKVYFLINNITGDNVIKDIMSKKIIFASINDSVKDISKLMKDNNIGFIPIKSEDKYVGVITDRDIALNIVELKSINDSIKSYITNNIIYIDVDSTIDEALSLMSKYKIKRLLVKDKDSIIGVLSLSDILNYSNSDNIIKTYKTIFYIHNNDVYKDVEIDSFYL